MSTALDPVAAADRPKTVPQVSVIVVNYNTRDHLLRCLASFRDAGTRAAYEVIVVDNGSGDGSVEAVRVAHPWARVIANPVNRYYTAAANQGLQAAAGEAILYFNTDAWVTSPVIDRLFGALRASADIGAVGCRFVSPDGRAEPCVRRALMPMTYLLNFTVLGKVLPGWRRRHNAAREYAGWDRRSSREVDTCADICLLVRRSALDAVGGYHEGFKLYFCEDDLCRKLRATGLRILFLGDTEIVHAGHASVRTEDPERIRRIWRQDALEYSREHFGRITTWGLAGLMHVTDGLRALQARAARWLGTPAPRGWWDESHG